MKKSILIVIAALLLAICPSVFAQEELPQELLILYEESNGTTEYSDIISFDMPDGTQVWYIINDWGFMEGYRLSNGEWNRTSSGSPTASSLFEPYFVRHDTTTMRVDGSFYSDSLGYDLLWNTSGERISLHYNGEAFVVCGWENAAEYAGEVILNDRIVSYYPKGSSEPEATYTLGERFAYGADYDYLPYTPKDARRLSEITKEALLDRYSNNGYSLHSYYTYNHQHEAHVTYRKIENNVLYVIRESFTDDRVMGYVTECVPVPLSQEFVERLEREDATALLFLDLSSDIFQTDDALDRTKIPVRGRIINSHLQERVLILLTEEDDGHRYLHIVEENEGQYTVQTSKPLPNTAYLDVFHSGEGDIQIEWSEDGYYQTAGYVRRADDEWKLSWVMNSGENTEDYNFVYCGVLVEIHSGSSNGVYFGSVPDFSFLTMDITQLPRNKMEMMALVDRSEWAFVNNPDPADRLHLRAEPDRDAKSLGKFYNRTPVKVLQTKGDWCKVQIGLDGYLTGWMMKKYLAFGDKIDTVDCAFPDEGLKETYSFDYLYDKPDEEEQTHDASGEYWIVGVVEDEWYVILTTNGESGYLPQDRFWEGNG